MITPSGIKKTEWEDACVLRRRQRSRPLSATAPQGKKVKKKGSRPGSRRVLERLLSSTRAGRGNPEGGRINGRLRETFPFSQKKFEEGGNGGGFWSGKSLAFAIAARDCCRKKTGQTEKERNPRTSNKKGAKGGENAYILSDRGVYYHLEKKKA